VVDDNVFNIASIKSMLNILKISSDDAPNGKQALAMLMKSYERECYCDPYSYVLTDLHMPIMDGFELCEAIQKLINKEEINPTNIIVMTGGISKEENKRCKKMGIQKFVQKPVFLDKLKQIMKGDL